MAKEAKLGGNVLLKVHTHEIFRIFFGLNGNLKGTVS